MSCGRITAHAAAAMAVLGYGDKRTAAEVGAEQGAIRQLIAALPRTADVHDRLRRHTKRDTQSL